MDTDTMLVLITGLSLALAAVMSLLVWTMVREERRRSQARVAALQDLAGDDVVTTRRVVAADLPLRDNGRTAPELFAEPSARPSWGPRIALAAGVLAVAFGIGFTYWPDRDADIGPALSSPLELVALRHESSPGALTVSGIVRNPADGAALKGIIATAYVLASDGEILASARAPIDVVTFGAGEESPFHVAVATPGQVARYRVGFRDENGQVVAHVDRRAADEAVAQK
jgi:hypothetical protein